MSDYCIINDVKTRLDITSSEHDPLLSKIVTAVSRAIDHYCGRVFFSTSTTRYFDGDGSNKLMLFDDLLEVTSITNDSNALDEDDYILYPLNSTPTRWIILEDDVWVRGNKKIAIEGSWGYCEVADIPLDLWNASVELACRVFKMKDSAYADASANIELGQLIYQKAIPANIVFALDNYRVKTGGIIGV